MKQTVVYNNGFKHLVQVILVMMLGGPAPAPVYALSCNVYTVSGDNPSTVPINMFNILLLMLITFVSN